MQYFLRLTCDLPKIAGKLTVGVWKIAKTNPINIMYVCMCVNQIYIYIYIFFFGIYLPNSPNQHLKNCVAESKEYCWWDLGIEMVKIALQS